MNSLAENRNVAYFKRFKMEIDLYDAPPVVEPPPGYFLVPWRESLLTHHAEIMFGSFFNQIDATVFPSLGDRQGSFCLMSEIRRKAGFLPEATWLMAAPNGYCGSIQGIRERPGLGAIQNLGITAQHRGQGLGTILLLQALHGFRRAGMGRAFLEVTARNEGAVRLYRRLGFRQRKTIYKAVEALTANRETPMELASGSLSPTF
jgi:ribosomal protein S18 acetylase RimI-like enzyme